MCLEILYCVSGIKLRLWPKHLQISKKRCHNETFFRLVGRLWCSHGRLEQNLSTSDLRYISIKESKSTNGSTTFLISQFFSRLVWKWFRIQFYKKWSSNPQIITSIRCTLIVNVGCKFAPGAEFLDEIKTNVLTFFFLAIHSHLYSFALRFLLTHATSYSFYSSVTVHCKWERRKIW